MNVQRSRRVACLSAAVAAMLYGGHHVRAADLVWDANATADPLGQDGPGTWVLPSDPVLDAEKTWVSGGVNVAWTNGDNATFGNNTSAPVAGVVHNIEVGAPITVNNINLGIGADGGVYNITSFSGHTLTLTGNVTKIGGAGLPQFTLFGAPLELAAGDHVFALRDTPGGVAELSINGEIAGAGGVRLDHTSVTTEAWGTLAFNADNTYTGVTNIDMGRLIITTPGGLGSNAPASGTVITHQGSLSIGGAGTTVPSGGINVTEPLTIQRSVYSGGEFGRYGAAVIFENGTGNHTISAPIVIDSADARIAVLSSTLTLPGGNISLGPNGAAGVMSFAGDFAGVVNLEGSNPALATNGIKLVGGVEVRVATHDALGGASAPITFGENGSGSATLAILNGFMTDFGTHAVNYASFSGGLNIPAGHTFTISQDLGTAGANLGTLGKRGEGTLNLSGTNNLTGGQTFFDAGVVNITGSTTLDNLHLRSPTVNIGTGGVVTLLEGFSALGQDSTGTNGGPDKAILNITGTGQLISQPNVDFNVSDNANTEGTINLQDSGTLSVGGLMHVAKSVGGKGTINQTGGTFTLTRDGNFTLVLGSRDGTGTYNLSGGTMGSEGEFYVGQGRNNLTATGTGTFTMTGGTVNLDHWFVVGREGGVGTVDMSGGIFNKTRGGTHTEVDVFGGAGPSTMTIRGNAEYRAQAGDFRVGVGNHATAGPGNGTLTVQDSGQLIVSAGEFWVGQGGATGVVNLEDSGNISINNWVAIGRQGGTGTFNMSGGTLTKTGGGNHFILASQGGSNGTFNQTGGTYTNTASETWINEGGVNGVYNLSGGTANIGRLDVGRNGGGTGTFNLSGTGAMNAGIVRLGESGSVTGTVNLDGGTLTATQVIDGASSGASTVNFNGGTLKAAGDHAEFMQGLTAANVKDGGAVIDSNGFAVTAAQPLVANGTGGLTKNGAGTLRLDGANTFTGATVANAGKLVLGKSLTTSSSVTAANDATIELADDGSHNQFINTPSVTIAPGASIDLRDNKLVTNTPVGSFNGTAYTGIQGEVQRAYNFGAWDQPGLKTSMPEAGFNAGPLSGTTTIATATAEQVLFIGPSDTAVFQGQTVTGATTIAMYTYAGDLNMDGLVDGADYGVIDNYVQFPGTDGYVNGDFNYDGIIDGADYGVIDNTIQLQGAPFPGVVFGAALASASSGGLSGVTAVPEPSACGFAILGAAALLGRRRRRHRG